MGFVQRTWLKDTSSESKMYPDAVYMYDAGIFTGILTIKIKENIKQWSGFTVVSRVKTQETVVETLEPTDDHSVPMRFFSVEKYPAKIEPSILWIPGWKIQLTQQPHRATEERSDLPLPPQERHLTKERHQRQQQPSLQPAQSHRTPSSPSLVKLPSGKQGPSQHSSQNKSNSASTQKVLLSSNRVSHGRQKQLTPGMSGGPPLLSSPSDQTAPLSQQHPLPQLSPSPPLPSTPEGSSQPPTSSSPIHSNLKQHLPSQRSQHRRGGKSQHPSFSQLSSHE